MSLRAALLALISAGPCTGYDAAKRFGNTVGHLWHAPDSQIYPELRRMEAAGLLNAKQVPWGSKNATKTQYSLTKAGRSALADWQSRPLDYAPERDEAHLLAAYFEWAPSDEDARARLREHVAHFTEMRESAQRQLDGIRASDATGSLTNPTLARRLTASDPAQHDRIIAFKRFAYEGKIARADAEIQWARDGLALIDKLESNHSH